MQFEIQRYVLASFCEQLQQPRHFLQVVAGPRRVRRMGWMLFATGTLAADQWCSARVACRFKPG